MQTYTVRSGQNIYDVCVQLYGSVEGLLDLLISNPSLKVEDYGPEELIGQPLTMNTVLSRGVILNYHETSKINSSIVQYFDDNDIHVANGDHSITLQDSYASTTKFVITHSSKTATIGVKLRSGSMYIDWGDFSDPEKIEDTEEHTFDHAFKSSDQHIIKIYGDFIAETIDFSALNGTAYPTDTVQTHEFITNNENPNLIKLINIID